MTKRRVHSLSAQVDAVVTAAFNASSPEERELLFTVSERLSAQAQAQEKKIAKAKEKPPLPPILDVGDGATPADIAAARRMQSVKVKDTVLLPTWPDKRIGLPNVFIRSSICSASRENDKFLVNELLEVNDSNVKLEYTGPQLSIYDRNVLATCIQICRDIPMKPDDELSEAVKPLAIDVAGFTTLSVYAFCTAMNGAYGATPHAAILASLRKLDSALVHIDMKTPTGSELSTTIKLLDFIKISYDKDKPQGSDKISIKLHSKLANLYGQKSWSQLPTETFGHNGLKGFLLGFYGTHGKPFAVSLEKLQSLAGIEGRLASFRQLVTKALDALQDESIDEPSRVESYALSKSLTHIVVFMKRWQVTSAARKKVLADLEAWSQKPVTKKTIKVRIAN